jgi:thiol-disulfide isomerase/thioredoxin
MKKRSLSFAVIAVVFVLSVLPLYASLPGSLPEKSKVDNFSLKDYNGKSHSLDDYKKSKAIVLIFVSTQCPVSNAYNERMAGLQKKYGSKDVAFLGINSTKKKR